MSEVYLLSLIWLFITYSIPIINVVLSGKNEIDIFNPNIIAPLFWMLQIPYLVRAIWGLEDPFTLISGDVVGETTYIFYYTALNTLAFVCMVSALNLPATKRIAEYIPSPNLNIGSRRRLKFAFLLLLIGVSAYSYAIYQAGGFYILYDPAARKHALPSGYLLKTLRVCLIGGVLLYASRVKSKQNIWSSLLLALVVTLLLASFGERTHAILNIYAFSMVLYYNTGSLYRKVSLKTFSYSITVVSLLFILVVGISVVRKSEGINEYLSRSESYTYDLLENSEVVAQRGSGIERKMLMIHYFDPQNVWLGRSYKDLLFAPIPSSLFVRESKPPLNEGYYIRSISEGFDLSPSLPRSRLPNSAIPTGTWSGYANFWLPGLLLYYAISGILLGVLYQYMRKTRFFTFAVLAYGWFSFRGEVQISNPGIVDLIFLSVMLFVLSSAIYRNN